MTRIVDAVTAKDGRWLGIRCAECGLVFLNICTRGRPMPHQMHADHTWTHIDSPTDLENQ